MDTMLGEEEVGQSGQAAVSRSGRRERDVGRRFAATSRCGGPAGLLARFAGKCSTHFLSFAPCGFESLSLLVETSLGPLIISLS